MKWSAYHDLKDAAEQVSSLMRLTLLGFIPNLHFFVAELYFAYYLKLGLAKRPNEEDEKAWCEWLQQNLNGFKKQPQDLAAGNRDPPNQPDPSDGQYSIEVIVGWSRRRILIIVVIPFILFLICTTTFALLWSVNLGAHHSNVSAGFSIASYFAGLAGGEFT
jgi:hypothetical protein